MPKYRKKPVVIEAMLFDGSLGSASVIAIWMQGGASMEEAGEGCRFHIETLEGDMEARAGDYIIRGVKGEFYPCKPDIFEQTYELVE